ncbi:hypothetical protein LSH36_1069g00047 [Paralvinella palmiformis]|uniref:SAM domain-containing protein n=1 Tax=Paralvinella palmiformis TaxID=53620 RepID=A0AAD9MQE4_9ANNE|nr:hypothetical protein LSH36_1069g00047 [Paralvinella palmiformis]
MSSQIEEMKDQRVPQCLFWSIDDVANWIEAIGFPHYKECFAANSINGRNLILVDASTLPAIGVKDFQHILVITDEIRKLLGIEKLSWNRSISLAPRETLGLYLERKSKTGKESDAMTYAEFLIGVEDMKWEPPLGNHGLILPNGSSN